MGMLACAALVAVTPRPGHALQPLDVFLESARSRNFDNREARAVVAKSSYEADSAFGRLLPVLTAKGAYTYNQHESNAQRPNPPGAPVTVVIVPENQWDVIAGVQVPIYSYKTLRNRRAAEVQSEAARMAALETGRGVEKLVASAYFQYVASRALEDSARKSLATAEENLRVIRARRDAGTVPDLDVDRAAAEVEMYRQELAGASELAAVARRSLETLSGIPPEEVASYPDSGTTEVEPLDYWESKVTGDLPSVRTAMLEADAAEKRKQAARGEYLPVVSGLAQNRWTNARGFPDKTSTFSAGVSLDWRIDLASTAATDAASAEAEAARIRSERALRNAQDEIFAAWQRVKSQEARSRSSRAQLEASEHAAELAKNRYEMGKATYLDVIQAERDAFVARVAVHQAAADLAAAMVNLRLSAGLPAVDESAAGGRTD